MLHVKRFTFNPVQENTYLLYNDEKECCIIDPGCYFAGEETELSGFIRNEGLKPLFLLNTHCHLDHIFGNRFVHRTFGLELYLHPLEKQVLDYGPVSGQMWQLPFDNYDGPLHYLDEKDTVQLGGETISILFTPGHSPGHICFYHAESGILIAGDTLFRGSVGRTDLPGGSFVTLEQSIRSRLYTLPDTVTVYPGHGDATAIGAEKRNNPFVKGE